MTPVHSVVAVVVSPARVAGRHAAGGLACRGCPVPPDAAGTDYDEWRP